ncbi:thiamine diphosphokinase [Agathobaculum sp.]|uniref:thiamine diphosphokinase n=1 Tax=Agathobaculum sp. TaxID=2048138 RepID=UPI002A81D634|nr:thiamine diphosphokinase [Agathobaculum sp.]MDY3618102.1 thiamine diphosphokinase [Agathobaculum sp.]
MGTFQGRHALIFAAAPETEYGYIRSFLAEYPDAVIACADGGLRHARALGLRADFMVSDCDSFSETEASEVLRLKPEKDDTDTQSCLREVFRRGCREATLVCATGGRIDHMLANLSLLEEAYALGGQLTVLDRQNKVVLHQGGHQKFKMTGNYSYFSIVPLDSVLTGVSIENAKYPLDHVTVTRSGMITISNEALGSVFSIDIAEGRALVVFSRD